MAKTSDTEIDSQTFETYGHSLELPQIFSHVKNARRFAIDIGGSLAKLAYSTTVNRRRTVVTDNVGEEPIYRVSESEEEVELLSFVKFETKYIESCLNFIQQNLMKHQYERMKGKTIKVTGGGAYKYKDLITSKLGCQIDKEDEMDCLLTGCNFLLRRIPDEAFIFQRNPGDGVCQYKFEPSSTDVFPYLLVNIGSGVSILYVDNEGKYSRVGGTSMGGGTFWGLGAMLTGAKSFDELLKLAATGNHKNVDLLVKDIYGGAAVDTLKLPGDLLACSMGKVNKLSTGSDQTAVDIAQSLLFFISNDIAQMACLHARLNNVKKIYFGGFFIRGHPLTMQSISFAIKYWSQGHIQALFLRHEGYIGAIGAYLKGAEESNIDQYSWGESYLGSSGLTSPRAEVTTNMFEAFQISRHQSPLISFYLLSDPSSYIPDVVDLTQDADARRYWLNCFDDSLNKFTERAINSQSMLTGVEDRAVSFSNEYRTILSNLSTNPTAYGSLTVRSLLDMREQCLHNAHFTDIYLKQKQMENEGALTAFTKRVNLLDSLTKKERWIQLFQGVLAGNIFDWGAKAVSMMLEEGSLDFELALQKLKVCRWLFNDMEVVVNKLMTGGCYRCVTIFCDNSGADVVLGIIPLARQLLINNIKVILCANSQPVLNDVTYTELSILINRLASQCDVIAKAAEDRSLLVMETGQASPCLDFRFVDENLCRTMKEQETDLIILEGMGRAVHTNFFTSFKCDSLKVAVIKNEWLAHRLGGEMFSVVMKYDSAYN